MSEQAISRAKKSTNVRKAPLPQRLALGAVRTGFRLAERAAPELGSRWAERLWFTPPRPRPNRDLALFGERFQVDADGHTVAGQAWGEGQPVYLVHGWGGTGAQLVAFISPLVAAGFRVITYDAPSHGASAPGRHGARQSSLPEMAAALTAVAAQHGPPYAVIAHSLGAPAAAIAIREGLAPKRLVFLAPAAGPVPYTYEFARRLGFGERIRQGLVRRIEERFDAPITSYDVPPLAEQVSVPPLLAIHDPADRETRYADSVAIAAAWPDSRLVQVDGLGHYRILRDPDVIAAIVDFL